MFFGFVYCLFYLSKSASLTEVRRPNMQRAQVESSELDWNHTTLRCKWPNARRLCKKSVDRRRGMAFGTTQFHSNYFYIHFCYEWNIVEIIRWRLMMIIIAGRIEVCSAGGVFDSVNRFPPGGCFQPEYIISLKIERIADFRVVSLVCCHFLLVDSLEILSRHTFFSWIFVLFFAEHRMENGSFCESKWVLCGWSWHPN